DDDDDDDDEDDADLGELEEEELQMLTADEESETLLVDEKAEAASIRRAELALDVDPEEVSSEEFVCQSCFLVLRRSQMAGPRKKICRDCAA
ncbi:MAG: DUF4193 family protein, partial [Acidimicrobiia bacterium]|nr:DUF4193 family protein [Acidimicrobiia bacterium]